MNSNESFKTNSLLLMPLNPLNNIYEQILQRNLAIFSNEQQQQSMNMNSQLLDYQLRYRTLVNTAQSYLQHPLFQKRQEECENSSLSNQNNVTESVDDGNLFSLNENLIKNEVPKPTHSYIGLIALAILSTPEKKLVLSEIYQWISDNYLYFRNRGPGWRNSIRHNLSLNDCFIKCGRSINGKGHYWAIHPANLDDFSRGDFRRRRAQRRVRKSLGLIVPEEEEENDDDYEIEEEEYEEDLAASSGSSVSPKNYDSNIMSLKRNLASPSEDIIPEKR